MYKPHPCKCFFGFCWRQFCPTKGSTVPRPAGAQEGKKRPRRPRVLARRWEPGGPPEGVSNDPNDHST
jgi:hypothetical protein